MLVNLNVRQSSNTKTTFKKEGLSYWDVNDVKRLQKIGQDIQEKQIAAERNKPFKIKDLLVKTGKILYNFLIN